MPPMPHALSTLKGAQNQCQDLTFDVARKPYKINMDCYETRARDGGKKKEIERRQCQLQSRNGSLKKKMEEVKENKSHGKAGKSVEFILI